MPYPSVLGLQQRIGNKGVGRLVQRFGGAEHTDNSLPQAAVERGIRWDGLLATAKAATRDAIRLWQGAAVLTGVQVHGPLAHGGQVKGPPLTSMILPRMMSGGAPPEAVVSWASAIGAAWSAFSSSLSLPGLPLYPSFGAFPGPMAPPTPNVPVPLLALTSRRPVLHLPPTTDPAEAAASAELAAWFNMAVGLWMATTMVTNLMGTGPVPMFAPPNVPVGPVIAGKAFGGPGFLAGGSLV